MTLKTALVTLVLLAGCVLGYAALGAETKPATTLSSLQGKDIDGNEITFESKELASRRLAFVFFTSWSTLSQKQARQVLASRARLGGTLVFICVGPERHVRELREEFGHDSGIWLQADAKHDAVFSPAFTDHKKIDHAPSLIVVNESRRVVHASMGELSDDEVATALAAKGE